MADINTQVISERFLKNDKNQTNMQKYASRIKIAEGIRKEAHREPLNLEVKTALSTCLENTRQICEATQSSHIPSKTFFMDMVASVIPNTIAPEIVSIQAMDAKAGMISYLRFVYGDKKGKAAAGQMFNNSLYHGQSVADYSASTISDEPLVTGAGATLSFYPVIPGTVRIKNANFAVTAVDDGNGKLFAPTDTTKATKLGTIDYATGVISTLNIEDETVVDYEYDNETAPVKVPQINLELAQVPIFAKSRKLAAYWGFDAAYDLKKQYGEEVSSLMAVQAAGEIAYEIDTEIVMDLYNQAGAGADLVWSKTAPHGVSLVDHYDSFWAKLVEGDAAIFGATQRFSPNFICCGINVLAVMQVMRNFSGDGAGNGVGPHFAGTLGGKYKVYVVPAMGANDFVMGYKGTNFLETGYVYAPYMPVLSTDLLTLANMTGQQGYATSYGKKMVNNKLYIKGHIVD